MDSEVPKERRPEALISPRLSSALSSASATLATNAAVKIRQVRAGDHAAAVSSSTKSTPPMGAPNAAAIPAPAPALMKSRLSRSLWKRPRRVGENSKQRFLSLSPRVTPDAIPAPMWMRGASAPMTSPEAQAKMVPTILSTMVRSFRKRLTCTPLMNALISARPSAAVMGSTKTQRKAATSTNVMFHVAKNTKACTMLLSESKKR
mmetsp:Transcript_10131/g.23684  ORF Transcript_10131/g.23684 Transcript_10131/m.23684 type:complete len:205 (-) Transcript_10131:652-1266(-)